MSWFLLALQKYAVFQGRSRRKEYWYFVLFYFIVSIILTVVDLTLFGTSTPDPYGYSVQGPSILSGIFYLAVLIPSLAVSVRRLHDSDRSGWWVLIGFIPLIGFIVLIVFMCTDSTPGPNRFGPNPKEEGVDYRTFD